MFLAFAITGSFTVWSTLTVFDMKNVPALWGQGEVSPFDGWNAIHELSNFRMMPENFGVETGVDCGPSPYPRHHQSKKEDDYPQNWPSVALQFLFPLSFIPNQSTTYDPLHEIKLETLAKLLVITREIKNNSEKISADYRYFLEQRQKIFNAIYVKFSNPAITKKIDLLFDTINQNYKQPGDFLLGYSIQEKGLLKELERQHTSQLEPNLAKKYENHFLRRKLAENFANAVMGTFLLSQESAHNSYYATFMEKALYASFCMRFESRKDILALFKAMYPKNKNLLDIHEKDWINDAYTIEDFYSWQKLHPVVGLAEWREVTPSYQQDDASYVEILKTGFNQPEKIAEFKRRAFSTKPSFFQPDFLAFIARASFVTRNYLPVPYKKAKVDSKTSIPYSHSDCGETTLRYIFGAALYDGLGAYDPTLWDKRVQHFGLKPRLEIRKFFEGSEGKRTVFDDCKTSAHDMWSNNVVSRLNDVKIANLKDVNKVKYTKPSADEAICEINPGLDNILNIVQRLLGDYEGEELVNFKEQTHSNTSTLSLYTLSALEAAELKEAPPEQHKAIIGKFRVHKINRFFKLIAPIDHSKKDTLEFRKITWTIYGGNRLLQENFATLLIRIGDKHFHWEIQKDHFDLKLESTLSPAAHIIQMSQFILPQIIDSPWSNSSQSNLQYFVGCDILLPENSETIFGLKKALTYQPELIYTFPIAKSRDRVKIALWIVHNQIEALYPRIEKWLTNLKEEGSACHARLNLGGTFEHLLKKSENKRLVSEEQIALIEKVLATIKTPQSLVFSPGMEGDFRKRLFQKVSQIRKNDPEFAHDFFNKWSCNINLSYGAAKLGLVELFDFIHGEFTVDGLQWLKNDSLFAAIRRNKCKANECSSHRTLVQKILDLQEITPAVLLEFRDESGFNVLHCAIINLFSNGWKYDESSLFHAQDLGMLSVLINSNKITKNHFLIPDKKGDTPLHIIATERQPELLKWLENLYDITTDDLSLKNNTGKTVLDLLSQI